MYLHHAALCTCRKWWWWSDAGVVGLASNVPRTLSTVLLGTSVPSVPPATKGLGLVDCRGQKDPTRPQRWTSYPDPGPAGLSSANPGPVPWHYGDRLAVARWE
ncbi:hypothetical protein BO71DRAFT_395387 [Aspergillus ellipticus CBS 707.79]|uniref:Uncharacterized protein n=1 Tax=Aspergillus ellipticus CBS 707.79 TaxID=1448320 RepID=A0A319DLN3_9EURO|nr:hypothetical protein BO71DRAFT_395387 [Aspergillus ellipticus CBS 707.79]